jgi:putative hydrolases of HD superfamily
MDIGRLAAFSRLITDLAKVERRVPIPGTARLENDVEHSYHLTFIAWYLIASEKLNLDVPLVLKYALAHDLVEVHAGDTYIYSDDSEHLASKHEREAAAARKLAEDFPEFGELHALIREYEERKTPEARFVYALDKVVPLLIIRDGNGQAWRDNKVTLEMLIDHKAEKVAVSPEVAPYFDELIVIIREEKLTA